MRTWKHSLGLCAVLACATVGVSRAADNWVEWHNNYEEGLRLSRETHKPLLVEFRCEA